MEEALVEEEVEEEEVELDGGGGCSADVTWCQVTETISGDFPCRPEPQQTKPLWVS